MSRLFASSGQSIGVSASASVLPMNIQVWFLLGLADLISLQSKGLSRVFSSTTIGWWIRTVTQRHRKCKSAEISSNLLHGDESWSCGSRDMGEWETQRGASCWRWWQVSREGLQQAMLGACYWDYLVPCTQSGISCSLLQLQDVNEKHHFSQHWKRH